MQEKECLKDLLEANIQTLTIINHIGNFSLDTNNQFTEISETTSATKPMEHFQFWKK